MTSSTVPWISSTVDMKTTVDLDGLAQADTFGDLSELVQFVGVS